VSDGIDAAVLDDLQGQGLEYRLAKSWRARQADILTRHANGGCSNGCAGAINLLIRGSGASARFRDFANCLATAAAIRRHLADSPDRKTAEPLTTLGGVEPVKANWRGLLVVMTRPPEDYCRLLRPTTPRPGPPTIRHSHNAWINNRGPVITTAEPVVRTPASSPRCDRRQRLLQKLAKQGGDSDAVGETLVAKGTRQSRLSPQARGSVAANLEID
jgi:hypothetical protein